MDTFIWINENIIWGLPMLALFIGAGIFFSIKLRFFQFTSLGFIFRNTLFSKSTGKDSKNLSPFQTLTASLATTLGTGNIVAVAAAVSLGGAGALFWMWLSAMLGMATCYAENALGMKYRRKKADGTYFGGSFLYLEHIFGRKAGVFYAVLCIVVSLFMGNMAQINAMTSALNSTYNAPPLLCGIIAAMFLGAVIFGGVKTLGRLTEKLIPIVGTAYILGCLTVIAVNFTSLGECFARIFTEAFGIVQMGTGISAALLLQSMSWGFRRGIFSNEAGLGSTVMISCNSSLDSPQRQGMWSMLQVWIDTIIMCTLTALVVILTGADKTSADGTQIALNAFGSVFGDYAGMFIALSITVFALSTAAGWSVYGSKCIEYLFGEKAVRIYLAMFTAVALAGSVAGNEIIWQLSDFFNGIMASVNIFGIICLGKGSVNAYLFNFNKITTDNQ